MQLNELNTTKILNVQSLKYGSEDDAGYDMYLPKFDMNFLYAIKEKNTKLSHRDLILKQDGTQEVLAVSIFDENGVVIMIYSLNTFKIFRPIAIPTGIQFLMPEGYWGEMCNRSSNFSKNLNVVTGYIDNTYTFGSAFQINPIDFSIPIYLEAETRIAQLILRPQIKPSNVHHNFEHFENCQNVIENRQKRAGGFGSTGTK